MNFCNPKKSIHKCDDNLFINLYISISEAEFIYHQLSCCYCYYYVFIIIKIVTIKSHITFEIYLYRSILEIIIILI